MDALDVLREAIPKRTEQWMLESKPQSAETMAIGIANDLLGSQAKGAIQMLTARLVAWEEAIIGRTLARAKS